MMKISDVRIIDLPKILDMRGNLSFVEQLNHLPFKIRRTYWLYDVPGGEARGGHAYKMNDEFIIALSGSFDVVIDDGHERKTFSLNRSYYGLYVPRGLWREIENFSSNAFALEFGSTPYSREDYIYDYQQYKQYKAQETDLICMSDDVLGKAMTDEDRIYDVFDCSIIELDKHHSDRKGNLSVVENGRTLPFDVKRAYYLYDIPGGESRGAHAHKKLHQFIVAASGSFNVTLDDGIVKRTFFLNRPYQGLYVQPGLWRNLEDFSSGAVCMVLASDVYKPDDYIRNYSDFLEFRKR